jgi:hypothetical protein
VSDASALEAIGAKLDLLLDRQAILDCLTAYCRGLDRMDDALTLSAYHPDAVDDHGAIVAEPGPLATWANASHDRFSRTQHVITNHSCDLDGDTAHTETYWHAILKHIDDEGFVFVGGRYVDRLEKRAGQWKIAARKVIVEWGGTPSTEPLTERARSYHNLGGRPVRDPSDPSYERPLRIDPARLDTLVRAR